MRYMFRHTRLISGAIHLKHTGKTLKFDKGVAYVSDEAAAREIISRKDFGLKIFAANFSPAQFLEDENVEIVISASHAAEELLEDSGLDKEEVVKILDLPGIPGTDGNLHVDLTVREVRKAIDLIPTRE